MLNQYLKLHKVLLIAIITMVAIMTGYVLGNTVWLRYKSEAVLNLEMTVPEYKRFSEAVSNGHNINELTKIIPITLEDKAIVIKEITNTVTNTVKWTTPLPKLNKAEAKDLPEILQKIALETENKNDHDKRDREKIPGIVYMGTRIAASAISPEQASRVATWLGNYFKEVATKEAVREQLFTWIFENRQFNDKAQSQQLKYSFEIEQAQARLKALKQVLVQYPEYAKLDTRQSIQIIDLNKDNEKFISLAAQLIGAESEIISIREKMAKLNREQIQYIFSINYLNQAETLFSTSTTGTSAVRLMRDLTLDKLANTKNEAEKEKLLSYAADISKISSRFLSQAQFIVPPSISAHPEQPRPLILAMLFGLLGLLSSLTWVFKQELIQFFSEYEIL